MLENRKPRHIRDIAHLYISRSRQASRPAGSIVWLSGDDRKSFPGLHAANLAAALAASGCAVRLLDRSAVLPNAGYYMMLSPAQYLRWQDRGHGLALGLGGVEVDCSRDDHRGPPPGLLTDRLALVHLPPLSSPERLQRELRTALRCVGAPSLAVIVTSTPPSQRLVLGSALGEWTPGAVCALRVAPEPGGAAVHVPPGTTPRPARTDAAAAAELGCVAGWESGLADRVPVVVRSPHAVESRAYRAAAEALLFEINRLERTSDERLAVDIPGLGSGAHHR